MTCFFFLLPFALILFLHPIMEIIWFTLCILSAALSWHITNEHWKTRMAISNKVWEIQFEKFADFTKRTMNLLTDDPKPEETGA